MTTAKCEQCGLVNDLADETCRSCGAELIHAAGSSPPVNPDYSTLQAPIEGWQASQGKFETTPAIGPFVSVGAALSPTIDLFKDNFWLITKIIFVIFAPFEIFKTLSFGEQKSGWQIVAGTFLLGLFCKALVAPSLIYALVTVMRNGVAPSLNESYRWGLSRIGKVIACALMAWALELLGFVCLIIPGIILSLAFELIYPMASLENRTPIEIIKRSYQLTKGYRLRIFCVTFVIGLLCGVVSIPGAVVSGILVTNGINSWPLNAVLALVTDIVNESTTILSLVIYLGITAHIRLADETPASLAVEPS